MSALTGENPSKMWQCKTSYLDEAEIKQDVSPDEAAGPVEAGKTLGGTACGSDKSAGPLSRSSIPKGNLGRVLHSEPAYEEGHDE